MTNYEVARSLAVHLWHDWFRDESPEWEPLDTLEGVLSQISNMIAGIRPFSPHYNTDRDLSADEACSIESGAGNMQLADSLIVRPEDGEGE